MCGWGNPTCHNRWTRQRQGSSSLVPVGWQLSSTKPMRSEDVSMCLPQSPIVVESQCTDSEVSASERL